MNEADVTRQIRDVLKRCSVFHWKNWAGPMTYPKGIADILGIYRGKFLAIEVKAPNWNPPQPGTKQYKHFKEQDDFLCQVRTNGGIGFFAQNVDTVVDELGLNVRLMPLFKRSAR